MLRPFAAIPITDKGTPIHGPTPRLNPRVGATKGKITYVKEHRTAEMIIEKLNVRTSSESVTSAEFNSLIDSINNYSFMRNAK